MDINKNNKNFHWSGIFPSYALPCDLTRVTGHWIRLKNTDIIQALPKNRTAFITADCHSSDGTNLTNNSQLDKIRLVFLGARCFVSRCSRLRLTATILYQLIIFATINTCIFLLKYKVNLKLYNFSKLSCIFSYVH